MGRTAYVMRAFARVVVCVVMAPRSRLSTPLTGGFRTSRRPRIPWKDGATHTYEEMTACLAQT
ncbi:hypothetical protein GCM10023084_41130 [Streptomyces lacrimifluminis]|uniref:Uncharacterized protein n=1 Tax=Streptomyces lacrimifluminis TaxID=1500077 RepID=A0A917L3N1_9ACTN|nr:hypothetical protein GCM10012282_42760 [Streptomyces lacrimifluminis]